MTFTVMKPLPFTYRVSGEPEPNDPIVVVLATKPFFRRSTGPIARHLHVRDPHDCSKSEADFLVTAGVAEYPPITNEAA